MLRGDYDWFVVVRLKIMKMSFRRTLGRFHLFVVLYKIVPISVITPGDINPNLDFFFFKSEDLNSFRSKFTQNLRPIF